MLHDPALQKRSDGSMPSPDSLVFDTKEGALPLALEGRAEWEFQPDGTYKVWLACLITPEQVNLLANHDTDGFRVTTDTNPWVYSIKEKTTWPAALREAAQCFLKGQGGAHR